MSDDIVIVGMARTPMGGLQGELSGYAAPDLGAIAVKAAVLEAAVRDPDQIIMGNVLSAGQGQAPARQAALRAGLPKSTEAVTLNKMCGSGLQAVVFGTKTVQLGDAGIVVSGGMESMSNVPYYLREARSGYRMGDGKLIDGMIFDGLWDPYSDFHMGVAGEMCAKSTSISWAFSRRT